MTSRDRDQLSVYLVFAEPGSVFIQAARSLAGAGAAVISHAMTASGATPLVMLDGSPFDIDAVESALPVDGCVWIRRDDGGEPVASIERRFLAP
ncbi:hypothetical protein K7957_00215 [Sphingomonas yunnanensis]|uniref:hypothetical protein n=1 Tax=Sphingomonas yunnanensis TaxID=310400 RepID=UPI001CA6D298|nr:hypothetical protein [Sphingomonas yunnanensis]MBY9061356.1 hypothetical protein [Sphingomonas yunnanensis]